MKTKKTWKDLQHGDVIKRGAMERTVIDVLPHSVLLTKFFDSEGGPIWLSLEDVRADYFIVQPEEERPCDYHGFNECDCKMNAEEKNDECNHLFHLERVMYSAGEHSDVAHFICEKCGFRYRRDLTN